jgi:hypothetical protein
MIRRRSSGERFGPAEKIAGELAVRRKGAEKRCARSFQLLKSGGCKFSPMTRIR